MTECSIHYIFPSVKSVVVTVMASFMCKFG